MFDKREQERKKEGAMLRLKKKKYCLRRSLRNLSASDALHHRGFASFSSPVCVCVLKMAILSTEDSYREKINHKFAEEFVSLKYIYPAGSSGR